MVLVVVVKPVNGKRVLVPATTTKKAEVVKTHDREHHLLSGV